MERELWVPPLPDSLQYIWSAWARIRRRTTHGMSGPNPITLESISAYSRLTGMRFSPYDVELIEGLDDLYMSVQSRHAEERESERDRNERIRSSMQEAAGGNGYKSIQKTK